MRFDVAATDVASSDDPRRRPAAGVARRAGHDGERPARASTPGSRRRPASRPRRGAACRSAPATSTSPSTCRASRWRSSTGSPATAGSRGTRDRARRPCGGRWRTRPSTFDVRGEGLIGARCCRQRHPAGRRLDRRRLPRADGARSRTPGRPARAGMDLTGLRAHPALGAGARRAGVRHGAAVDGRTPSSSSARRRPRACCAVNATARGSLAAPQLGGTVVARRRHLRRSRRPTCASRASRSTRASKATRRCCASFRANVATGGRITAEGRVDAQRGRRLSRPTSPRGSSTCATPTAPSSAPGSRASSRSTGRSSAAAGLLSGSIDLGRTEISVAEGLGGAAQAALEQVEHMATAAAGAGHARPRPGRASCARPRPRADSAGIGLDVRINAPNQIFVRGRGLDVELGGSLRIQGADDRHPAGRPVRPAARAAAHPRPAHRVRRGLAAARRQPRPADPLRRAHRVRRT